MSIMDQIMAKGINDMASKIKSLEARCEQLERENEALRQGKENLETVADVICYEMEQQGVENFLTFGFKRDDKKFEVTLRYVEGKTTAEVMNELQDEIKALKAERDAYEAKVSRIKNLFSELCDYHVANFHVPRYCFIGRTGVHQNWYELHAILDDDSDTLQLFLDVLASGKKPNLIPSTKAGGDL